MKKSKSTVVALLLAICMVCSMGVTPVAAKKKSNQVARFKAITVTKTSITLAWDETPGAAGYDLQQKKGAKYKNIKKNYRANMYTVSGLKVGKNIRLEFDIIKNRRVKRNMVHGKTFPQKPRRRRKVRLPLMRWVTIMTTAMMVSLYKRLRLVRKTRKILCMTLRS